MAVDPFLYVAFGIGWLIGRLVPHRSPWVPRATLACVGGLLALLGASFAQLPAEQLLSVLPYAALLAGLALGFTAVIARALAPRRPPAGVPASRPTGDRIPWSLLLLLALVAGAGVGRVVVVPTGTLIPWALYVLLALVAFGLDLRWAPLRRAWVPLLAAAVGALAAGAVVAVIAPWPAATTFATVLGFGWYSLAAPLVAARAGAALGLFAFVANFLREAGTMVVAPKAGPRLGGEGLTALGGATAMDTTLYFVVRFGDPESGSLALASGLVLTAAASLLVPLVLGL